MQQVTDPPGAKTHPKTERHPAAKKSIDNAPFLWYHQLYDNLQLMVGSLFRLVPMAYTHVYA